MPKRYDPTKERTRIITDEDLEDTEKTEPEAEAETTEAETMTATETEKAKKTKPQINKIKVSATQVPTINSLNVGDTLTLSIVAKIARKTKDDTAELEIIDITTPTEEATAPTSPASPTPTTEPTKESLASMFV